jgi:tRNA nucleotidyltransferase (CCA-adding enzyme)
MIPIVMQVCEAVKAAGGRALLVGGCVRDMQLGLAPEDWDIEVYGLSAEVIQELLSKIDTVDLVGESFSVWQFHHGAVDVNMPRRERKISLGHKGFEVSADPSMTVKEASARRDFTINSMAFDPLTGELLDYYGGLKDLKLRLLRHTSPAFSEDPLRVLRGAQFASRFGMSMTEETQELCRQLRPEAETLAKERVWVEWKKMLLGRYPASGLILLRLTEWLDLYPELAGLQQVKQSPKWHPEGDALIHTMICLNYAEAITKNISEEDKLTVMLGVLCHDLGKTVTTETDDTGIHHYGHAKAGVPLAESLLGRIGCPPSLVKPVLTMVREHMVYSGAQVTEGFVRRLTHKLSEGGTSLRIFNLVVCADMYGQAASDGMVLDSINKANDIAHDLEILDSQPKHLLLGRHLQDLKIAPGPIYSTIIDEVYQQQLDGKLNKLEEAIAYVREHYQT